MSLPEPPADLNTGESRVASIYAGLLIPWIFASVNICLRFTARRLNRNGIVWKEDWLALIALTTSTAQVFTNLFHSIPHGLGRHIWAAPADAAEAWALGLFIAEITYTVTMVLVKYSTLIFYWRVFSTKKSIRLPIWILAGVTTLWGISVILVTSLQCLPTVAIWERYDPVHPLPPSEFVCQVNVRDFVIGNAVPNIITDGLIILLPLPYVLSLQLPLSQTIALSGTFLLGLLVTLTSILRLVFFLRVPYTNPDVTWAFCDPIIWSNVECNLAIAVSSLPFLRPILNLIVHGRINTFTPSHGDTGSRRRNTKPVSGLGHERNETHGVNHNIYTSVTTRREDKRPFLRLHDLDLGRHRVKDVIELREVHRKNILVTREIRILDKNEESYSP